MQQSQIRVIRLCPVSRRRLHCDHHRRVLYPKAPLHIHHFFIQLLRYSQSIKLPRHDRRLRHSISQILSIQCTSISTSDIRRCLPKSHHNPVPPESSRVKRLRQDRPRCRPRRWSAYRSPSSRRRLLPIPTPQARIRIPCCD
jgi:hypothetical protein